MSKPLTVIQKLLSLTTTAQPTADQLRAKIAEAEAGANAATIRANALTNERKVALVTGESPQKVDSIDAQIAEVKREFDRNRATVEVLERALVVTLENEVAARKLTSYNAAKAKIDAARAWQETEYDQLAAELGRGLTLLKEADEIAEGRAYEIPDGFEPLPLPSHARRHQEPTMTPDRLYHTVKRLQALDPDAPHYFESGWSPVRF
jgi:hypothetical protein